MLIQFAASINRTDQAVDFFTDRCKPDADTYNALDQCDGRAGMALGNPSYRSTYNNLINACGSSVSSTYSSCGQIENCKTVFDLMISDGLSPSLISYNALIIGQPEKAREMFDKMIQNSCRPNIVSYNALIDSYGSEGKLAEALDVLREMERNGSTYLRCGQVVNMILILSAAKCRGIELNIVAYNSAIGSYLNMGSPDKALQLYESMKERKIQPDAVTFNILLSGLWKMGSTMTEAESMFAKMKEAGCCPDVVAYTAMIDVYGEAGACERAWETFQEMEMHDIQPDAIAYSSLMKSFNRGCKPERVLALAELMKEKSIPSIPRSLLKFYHPVACKKILLICDKYLFLNRMLRDWRTASELVDNLEPSFRFFSLGLFNQILHFFGKSGKVDSMMKLFYKMTASGLDVNRGTYSILLRHLLAAGKWRKYIEVLQWMEDAGIRTSFRMYQNALPYALKDNSEELIGAIQEKMGARHGAHRMTEMSLNAFHAIFRRMKCPFGEQDDC
ncbi:unnamed protein product [Spirodela intermedia]|uniref:Uncharacterized protein n=1 Tax=Spirodela intermedia TaxID=51605 RepID=A0A7I8I952_SPIIN|nr:unnamed protein product [Spirodela intermedia]CAA6654058.1 unnamed protein product [Spirodela intermedia]